MTAAVVRAAVVLVCSVAIAAGVVTAAMVGLVGAAVWAVRGWGP